MANANHLEQMARSLFRPLSKSELEIVQKSAIGKIAYCGPSTLDDDAGNDPAHADSWTAERHVRADLIRWLCSSQPAANEVDARGIQVHGARIEGKLDLSFLKLNFPIDFSHCFLSEKLSLRYIEVPTLNLSGSWVQSVAADLAVVKGTVFLKNSFRASGEVLFRGARIGGNLNCEGSEFIYRAEDGTLGGGIALDIDGARISGSVLLRKNFRTKGGVRLFFAEIGGSLECDNAKFVNPAFVAGETSGIALNAEGAKISGAVLLRRNFSAEGGVRLFRAEIGGQLECDEGRFHNPARIGLPQSGCALNAEGAKIGGSVLLRKGFSADGAVWLRGCEIGGNLVCDSSQLRNPLIPNIADTGIALNAEAAKVAGMVSFRKNSTFEGGIRLFGAEIGGPLACEEGGIKNLGQPGNPDSGIAFNAEGIRVKGNLLLRNHLVIEGQVRLFGARIDGDLDCNHAKFSNPIKANIPNSGLVLNGRGIKVGGSAVFRNFTAEGGVRLFGAEIGRLLDCTGGTFRSPISKADPEAVSLDISSARISGAVLLRGEGFLAEGPVRLFGSVIEGDLDCEKGTFKNPAQPGLKRSGVTLDAFAVKVSGSVLLRDNFVSEGQVQLSSATIARSLDCGGATLLTKPIEGVSHSEVALRAEAITVNGPVLLRRNFSAAGEVRLFGARIEESLDCTGGTFRAHKSPENRIALDASAARIKGDVLLGKGFRGEGQVKLAGAQITGTLKSTQGHFEALDLSDAFAGLIADANASGSWPEGKLKLDGFVYNRISEGPLEAAERLQWLERQGTFTRHPYRQLAKVLDNGGDDLGGRRVLSAMQRKVWEGRGKFGRFVGFILRKTIGYGYFPLRAIWLLITLVAIGSIVYGVAYNFGSIVPTDKDAYPDFEATCNLPNRYERFNPIAYSMENSFPLIKLGIQDKWAPAPEKRASCWPSPAISWLPAVVTDPLLVRILRWGQICVGWLLATLFVGGVTGILRKA